MKALLNTLCVAGSLMSLGAAGQEPGGNTAKGPLRVHPTNPRYFTDGTKNPDGSLRAVYLTGSHTWNNLVDMGREAPPRAFDFEAYLDFLARHDHNFIRLWAADSTTWDTRASLQWVEKGAIYHAAPQPWRRAGPGKAIDGKPKFDLTKFDPAYFERLRARVKAAGRRGIYVSVMLFEGWGLFHGRHPSPAPDNWSLRSHPFHRDNNVQGVGDEDGLARTHEVHTLKHKAVNDLQAAYIRKVVDTVNDLDNVLYEVINEGGQKDWNWWVAKSIQDYERTKPKQHPVGLTGHGAERLASLLASPAVWVSPGRVDGYAEDPPAWQGKKVSLLDTDHIWGVGGDAAWVWKSFLRGHNPIFMDPYDHLILGKGRPDQWDGVRRAMGATRGLAQRIDLAGMTPSPELASTRYCLAKPAREYLIYQPTSGEVSVTLPAGNYDFEWFDPTRRAFVAAGVVKAAGGKQTCTPPFSGPAVLHLKAASAQPANSTTGNREKSTLRVAACQAKRRSIDWRLAKKEDVLAAVEKSLDELEKIVHRAGGATCDALALPEDTLGLLDWCGMNEEAAKEVLPKAVRRMIDRLGRAAAEHRMYLVVCSDFVEADGKTYNTAFFLGRDGKEIGRYHKVCPTWGEGGSRARGQSFPVFPTPDLGTVGMLICYDLVMPETARCLALKGADVIFFPTMGGAAVGDDDIGVQALRVRAAENHVWLVVAFRGQGAMIISPRGKIVARADGSDGLAIADLDPHGGREGGDSSNRQKDMRARLFRERTPEAFEVLTRPNPPALAKVPIDITPQEAGRIFARMLTVGEEEFRQATALARDGKTDEAIAAFERLRKEYRGSWIDRVAQERLTALRLKQKEQSPRKGTEPVQPTHPVPKSFSVEIEQFFAPPDEYTGKLGEYRSVLKFDDGAPVRTAQDWLRRRAEIRQYWHGVMGAWPAPIDKPRIKYQDKEHVENFTRHKVEVEMAPGRLVGPQYLLIPDGQGPFPAVLVTWYNSADSAGLNPKVRGTLDFGYQLAQRGFVTLCIGGLGSEDGRTVDGKSGVQPLSYLAYVATNCRTALASLPQVGPRRIGIMGHSFGGKWAMFASCLDEKFACAVWSDPGIVWNERDPNANYWDKWYLGYEFDRPAERQRRGGRVTPDNPGTGAYKRLVAEGRDLHELHALMAPRPFLVSGGAQDRPDHWTALNHTIALNKLLGHTGRVAMTMRDGHRPTPESNRQAFRFLEHFLAPPATGSDQR